MKPAIKGEWWQSDAGAVYCVAGVTFGGQGQSARVEAFWITNHSPPQVHRVKLYVGQWKALTTKGTKLLDPPSHNNKGDSFGSAVDRVRERLAAR